MGCEDRLTEKQCFIEEADKELQEVIKEFVQPKMEEYKVRFGMNSEDMWLWIAGFGGRLPITMMANNMVDWEPRRKRKPTKGKRDFPKR